MKSYLLGVIGVLLTWTAVLADSQPTEEEPLPSGALQRFGSTHLRHGSGILASDLSPDGKLLATMSDRSVGLWDLATEKRVKQFHLPARNFRFNNEVRFSRDGHWLACWSESNTARIWDVASGKPTLELSLKPGNALVSAAFTLDSKEFRALEAGKLSAYDPATGRFLRSLDRPQIKTLLPDGQSGMAYDKDAGCLVITDIEGNKERWRTPAPEPDLVGSRALGRSLASDGKSIALAKESQVEIRELLSGKLRIANDKPLAPAPDKLTDRIFSSQLRMACNGGRVFEWGVDPEIRQWESATGKQLPSLPRRTAQNIYLLPTGREIVSVGEDGRIHRANAASGADIPSAKSRPHVRAAAVTKDGRALAVIDQGGQLDLWTKMDGQQLMSQSRPVIPLPKRPVEALAISPDAKHLAMSSDYLVSLVNLETRQSKLVYVPSDNGRKAAPFSIGSYLDFHPKGTFLIYYRSSEPLTIVAISTGAVARPIPSSFATYSTNGKRLASIVAGSNRDFTVQILDSSSFKELRSFHFPITRAFRPPMAAFSSDDRQLVVGNDNEMIFFDVQSGREVHKIPFLESRGLFPYRNHAIQSFAFSPEVDWMLSGGADGAVRLWEIATYKEMLCLEGHEGDVRTVAFGPNGVTAISAGNDGLAYLWDLRPKAPESKPTLDHLWQQLASDDVRLSYQAIWAIRDQAKEASVFLRNKIPPAKLVEKAQLQRLIKDLDSSKFQEREVATRTLAQTGDQAAPALEEALAKSPPLEMRQRLQKLLDGMRQGAAPEELRVTRAVQALALAGTPEALETLRTWAKGAPEARLTRHALAAVQRLDPAFQAR